MGEQKFFMVIDPDNNMSEGSDASEVWQFYCDEHNQYTIEDCRVLECTEKQVKVKLEFL